MQNKGQIKDKTAKINDFKKTKSRKSSLQKDLRDMKMVEHRGLEPLTPTLPVWCAPNCANAPDCAT